MSNNSFFDSKKETAESNPYRDSPFITKVECEEMIYEHLKQNKSQQSKKTEPEYTLKENLLGSFIILTLFALIFCILYALVFRWTHRPNTNNCYITYSHDHYLVKRIDTRWYMSDEDVSKVNGILSNDPNVNFQAFGVAVGIQNRVCDNKIAWDVK